MADHTLHIGRLVVEILLTRQRIASKYYQTFALFPYNNQCLEIRECSTTPGLAIIYVPILNPYDNNPRIQVDALAVLRYSCEITCSSRAELLPQYT